MPRHRNWEEGLDDNIKFLRKEGRYVYSMKDGFEFKTATPNWPPDRLTEESCLTPTEYFVHNIIKVHGTYYDLSKVKYTKSSERVVVICPNHGEFLITANSFKSGKGCKKCANEVNGDKLRGNLENFVKNAVAVHSYKYDYSLVDYKSAREKVIIVCKDHGRFNQTPSGHLRGRGCIKCAEVSTGRANRLTLNKVLDRFLSVHGQTYDYSQIREYKNASSPLTIVCREHGAFQQSMTSHYHKRAGCPTCAVVFNPARKSGFKRCSDSRGGYASLYLIKCSSACEVFYKIGITTHDVSRRFAGFEAMPYNYCVEHLHVGEAEAVYDLETELHREYRNLRYSPSIPFGGMTECFSAIDVVEYKKLLEILG